MTPGPWIAPVVAVLLVAAAFAYEWWFPRPPAPPPPWITREEVEQLLAVAILHLPHDPRVTTEQFAEPGRFLVTGEHLHRVLAERDQKPVPWITEQAVNARDQQLRELIASTPDEVHRIVITTLKGLPATYVPRAELIPLVAAYCRKALDEGGELRARIHALLPATPVAVAPSELTTLAAKADDAHARLTAAARKHPRPVRPAKKRARR